MHDRLTVAGCALGAQKLQYLRLAETIRNEQLGPLAIARLFRLSACKTARPDCAFILLCGSLARHRSAPNGWSPEPEASLACQLVGDDFDRISDEAARLVKARWSELQALVDGEVEAA